ncbi:hypothetical protein RDI58_011989 [Solanum bulbocastanum]|uniref:Methyltransferase n=1 Tax=Solanum bulbocastanum TaxID=147425 RepID=A0AAN8TYC1_SOLBU
MRKHNTALTRFGRKVKGSYQSYGLGVKLAAVVILGLCFVFIWSVFSPSSYSVAYQRGTFDDIREPMSSANRKKVKSLVPSTKKEQPHNKKLKHRSSSGEKKKRVDRSSLPSKSGVWHKNDKSGVDRKRKGEDLKLPKKADEVKEQELEGSETDVLEKENEGEKIGNGKQEEEKKVVEVKENEKEKTENNSKQEGEGKEGVDDKETEKEEIESKKEEEGEGEGTVDGNEGNGKLANTEELDQEAAEKMVPDIEWGKNIRVVLDIGCEDSSFGASLLEKDVLTLTLGLKDDLVDLAQVALERGFPAVVTPFGTRRLPFPIGVFDAIHCNDCHASWHSNGGKHLIEMNRILRPGGYFILSSKHSSIEVEEAMSTLTASICWNILADKTDEISDIRIKLYQKPQANDIPIEKEKSSTSMQSK